MTARTIHACNFCDKEITKSTGKVIPWPEMVTREGKADICTDCVYTALDVIEGRIKG